MALSAAKKEKAFQQQALLDIKMNKIPEPVVRHELTECLDWLKNPLHRSQPGT